jgi:hypothetical protein
MERICGGTPTLTLYAFMAYTATTLPFTPYKSADSQLLGNMQNLSAESVSEIWLTEESIPVKLISLFIILLTADSVVHTVTCYGLDGSEFEPW